MPYFSSSAEWYEQSRLLLEARPTTVRSCPTTRPQFQTANDKAIASHQARVVTKYSTLKPKTIKDRKRQVATSNAAAADAATPATPAAPQAALTFKTYDPASGVCLKYQTNKAAEVGRLVASLEKLSRTMAALPNVADGMFYLGKIMFAWRGCNAIVEQVARLCVGSVQDSFADAMLYRCFHAGRARGGTGHRHKYA